MENNIATADDFRAVACEQAFETPKRVVLPESGLSVVLRRPRLIFFTMTKNHYPAEVAQKFAGSGAGEPPGAACAPTADELKAYADWITEVLGAVFVKPKLSLTPGADEIHPNWLRPGDVQFIFQWITGGVLSPTNIGEDRFRSADAGSGAGGGDVPLPAVPSSAGDDRGVAN